MVFSSTNSYDTDGYVNYTRFFINGDQEGSVSYMGAFTRCFALYGSPAGDCYQLTQGVTTITVGFQVRDNQGEWSNITTKTYTIQQHKGRKYFITDHIGNVRATVNRDGNILGYDDYYPFGKVMQANNNANPNDNYKFTGHERDTEASLSIDYMNARTYDPITGIFMQRDPLEDQFPGWTPYHYVHNNPLNLIDPSGMRANVAGAGRSYNGVDVVNAKECQQCDAKNDENKVRAWWNNLVSVVGGYLSAAKEVNINLSFTDDEASSGREYSREEQMIADAILQDFADHGDKVEGIYNAMGYIPGADVAQDLYEGNYGEATLTAASYIPVASPLKLLKPLGRGSTGRNVAKSLIEDLAMQEIMSNPGIGLPLKIARDPRWKGWYKMSNRNAHGIEIHYLAEIKNGKIFNVDDFKFID